MSDDISLMTQKEIMRQLYTLQKESVENDAEFRTQMNEVIKRLDHREKTFEKISEEIAIQKRVFSEIDGVNKKLSELNEKIEGIIEWRNEEEKKHAVEDRDDEILSSKIKSLVEWQGITNKRLDFLENKTANTAVAVLKKIGGIALTVIVTAVIGYLIGKLKK